MRGQKKAWLMGALAAVALVAPACAGHRSEMYGTGGSGAPRAHCEVLHPDTYVENHPNAQAPVQPGVEYDGSAICR